MCTHMCINTHTHITSAYRVWRSLSDCVRSVLVSLSCMTVLFILIHSPSSWTRNHTLTGTDLAHLLLDGRIHERRIGCTHSGSTAVSGYPHVHCGIRYRFRKKRLQVNRGVRTRPLRRVISLCISLSSVAPRACDRPGPVTRAAMRGTGVYTLTSGDLVTCAGVLPACTGRVRK